MDGMGFRWIQMRFEKSLGPWDGFGGIGGPWRAEVEVGDWEPLCKTLAGMGPLLVSMIGVLERGCIGSGEMDCIGLLWVLVTLGLQVPSKKVFGVGLEGPNTF